jgi:hypothetical protein
MHLVQILLPLADNQGRALPRKHFAAIQRELTKRFSGLTAYSRAPAEGLWRPRKETKREEIIVYEVMDSAFDVRWWRRYRRRLEELFRQESVIIRAQQTEIL